MEPSAIIAVLTFLVAYGILATEKINRTIVVGAGSLVLLLFGVLSLTEAISYINWETVGLLLGMFIIVIVLSDAGFFSYLAFVIARRFNYEPRLMLVAFPLLAGLLAAFVDSITVMLFLAALTIEIAKILRFDPVPLVVGEVVLANTGGAATLVGDPPNVILGTQLGLGFNAFVANNGPIALVSALVSVAILFLMQRSKVTPAAAVDTSALSSIRPERALTNKGMLRLGLGALVAAITLLVTHEYLQRVYDIPITVALAALLPAFALLLIGGRDTEGVLKKVDYDVLLFFIGLFIIVGGLEKTGVIATFANGVVNVAAGNNAALLSLLLWGSGLVSGMIDNVPFALAMSYVIREMSLVPSMLATSLMVWTVSLGTDIGGNLTPIGASANVVAYDSLEKHGGRIGWLRWIKIAAPPTLVTLVLCDLLLYVKYLVGFY
jgi:Na+/H+ antiporter NhaD/arsenite permease-like protein